MQMRPTESEWKWKQLEIIKCNWNKWTIANTRKEKDVNEVSDLMEREMEKHKRYTNIEKREKDWKSKGNHSPD